MSGTDVDGVVAHDNDLNDLLTDEPIEDEQEATEQEAQTDEQPEETDAVEDEDETAEPEDADETEPETDPEAAPSGGAGKDKALQKLQQRQTTFEREVNAKLESILRAVQKGGEDPTPKQEQAVEDAVDEFADLIKGREDDDIVDVATLKKLANKIASQKPVDVQAEVQKALKAEKDREAQQQAEAERFLKEQAADVYEVYPELDGRYDELLEKTTKEVDRLYGELDQDTFNRKYNPLFWKIAAAEAAKAKAGKAKPTTTPQPARKAGTKPPKSATGASTKPTGAAAKAPAGPEIVPFDNSLDSIPDFDIED